MNPAQVTMALFQSWIMILEGQWSKGHQPGTGCEYSLEPVSSCSAPKPGNKAGKLNDFQSFMEITSRKRLVFPV